MHKSSYILSLLIFIGLLYNPYGSFSQSCDATTPSYEVDLTGIPDSMWISPNGARRGVCCGYNGGPPDNYRCVEFWLTLDEGAQGINFDIHSGAEPAGAMGWSLNCGPLNPVGEDICIDGSGPHWITFCKPGNNPNRYSIRSIPKPSVSPPTIVSNSCESVLSASGYQTNTIRWTSVPYDPEHNSYLSCTESCSTVTATYQEGAPEYVDYEVSGIPIAGCDEEPVTNMTRVYFINDKEAQIIPEDPVICYGGTEATITAEGIGGAPPYTYLWSTGETTQSIDVGLGTYTVEILDSTSCPGASATVTVTAFESPIVADAGSDLVTCENNPRTEIQGRIEQASGGIWSGGQGAFEPDPESLNIVYHPTEQEIASGSVTLTLTSTGNSGCPPSEDQMTITFTDPPTANAGPDQIVCSNNPEIQLNGTTTNADGSIWSGGNGTFMPSSSSPDAIYIPTEEEISNGSLTLTLSTVGAGNCLPVTDEVLITFTPAPEIQVEDVTVCANNPEASVTSDITVATGVSWSGGMGSFSDINGLSANYTPSQQEINNGSASITATTTENGNCSPVSTTATIHITPAPTVDAGDDRTVCANNATINLNGSVTTATGGTWSGGSGSFSNADSLNATYTPSSQETNNLEAITLTLTSTGNGDCLPVTDYLTINITPAPVVEAGPDIYTCANNPEVILDGNVENASGGTWTGGGGTFSPGNTSLTTSYTPSAMEIANQVSFLFLTSTGNGNCRPVRDTLYLIIEPAPTVSAGEDQTVCANNGTVNLNGSSSGASSIRWSSSGTGVFGNIHQASTTYTPSEEDIANGNVDLTLTAFRNPCEPVENSMSVTILPSPIVDAGSDYQACATEGEIPLNGLVENAQGGIWSGGNGTFSPDESNLITSYTPSTEDINNGSVTLTLTSTGNGLCLPETDQMNISLTDPPQANAGPDQTVCANNSRTSLSGSVTGASGGRWLGGQGTFSPNRNTLGATYTPSTSEISSGSVRLTLRTSGNGICPVHEDEMELTITPAPEANAGENIEVCESTPVANLSGSVSITNSGRWSGGQGVFGDQNSLSTSYTATSQEIRNGSVTLTLTSTNNGNCRPVSDQVRIMFLPIPEIDAGPDQTVCGLDNTIELNGSVNNATGGTWSSTGTGSFEDPDRLDAVYEASQEDIDNPDGVVLTLTSTGNEICPPINDQMQINFSPVPIVNAGPDKTVCTNNFPIRLEGSGSSASWSGGNGTFSPNNRALNAHYTPTESEVEDGTITLRLTTNASDICDEIFDEVTISIPPGPNANAGEDLQTCGTAPVSLNGLIENAAGGTWESSGTGSFSNSNNLNTDYTPSQEDLEAGHVTLFLSSTDEDYDCPPVEDRVRLDITKPIEAFAGNNLTICADNDEPISLDATVAVEGTYQWSTSGSGNFTDPSVLNTDYTLSESDRALPTLTLTLTTDPVDACESEESTVIIEILPIPEVNTGPDQTICSSQEELSLEGSYSNTSGVQWSSSGTGNFSPSDATNTTYTLSETDRTEGTITLTLTTEPFGSCQTYSDELLVTIVPETIVDAGPDQTLCVNNLQEVEITGTITGATGGTWTSNGSGTIQDPSSLNTTYTPVEEDTSADVTFTLTSNDNAPCPIVIDNLRLQFTPAPEITPGADPTICADASGVTLSASVTNASGIAWNHNGSGSLSSTTALTPLYSVSDDDISAESVTFTVTSTGNRQCLPVQEQIELTILPAPEVGPGPAELLCADALPLTLNGTSSTGSGEWFTSDGSGVFSPDNTDLNGEFFPSTAQISSGQVTIHLRSSNNGICNPVIRSVTHYVYDAPEVDAGENMTVCSNTTEVQLDGTVEGTVEYSWSTSGTGTFADIYDEKTTYTPGEEDLNNGFVELTLTAQLDGCVPITDNVRLIFEAAPLADAGPDQEVCIDESGVNLSGSISNATGGTWSSTGGGSFLPSNTNLNANYRFSQTDLSNLNVNLVLTTTASGACPPVSDTLNVTITPERPIANAGPAIICTDEPSIELQGQVTNASGGEWTTSGTGNFSNPNNLHTEYFPSTEDRNNGNVKLLLTSTGTGGCTPITDTIHLSIMPGPNADTGPDQTICLDVSTVSLGGSVTNATGGTWTSLGGGSFTPSPDNLSVNYIPSAIDNQRGSATLILTTTGNGGCLPARDTTNILITPSPTIDAGANQYLCADQTEVDLSGAVTIATGGNWNTTAEGTFTNTSTNGLTTTFRPDASEMVPGNEIIFTLTSTGNGDCQAVTDQMEVTITPAPIVDAGNDVTLCSDMEAYFVNAETQFTISGTWATSGTGSFANNASLSTRYFFSDDDRAPGNSIELTYTATSDLNCSSVSDEITVTFIPGKQAHAGPDQSVCNYIDEIFLNGSVAESDGGIWTTPGTGNFTNITENGTNAQYNPATPDTELDYLRFYLTTTDEGICDPVTDTLQVNLLAPPNIPDREHIVCNGSPAILEVEAIPNVNYEWYEEGAPSGSQTNTLETTANNDENSNQHFTVEATDANNCMSEVSVTLTTFPPPQLTLTNVPACTGDTLYLSARPSNIDRDDIASYEWYDGNTLIGTEPELEVTNEGVYTAIYRIGECLSQGSSEVNFHPSPTPQMERNVPFCPETESSVDIDAGDAVSFLWDNGETTPSINVGAPGTYYVTIFNEHDCPAEDSIQVREVCPPRVFVPNAIKPGSSDRDGFMEVLGANFANFKLTIFNRWGEIIFYSEDPNHLWDGYYRGEPMPIGTYPWIMEYTGDTEEYNKLYKKQGSITVVR
ncbi:gliding motility-associated C-terminal domain-containing protein [Cytophagaceae bacterium ABcell3]|nr:gliding motility-associated C-terminal domain-containing protein [Cytophagaceae bacterium ABcell3]